MERRALRFIGIAFFVLGAFVAFESGRSLLARNEPESSPIGIAGIAMFAAGFGVTGWRAMRGAASPRNVALRAPSIISRETSPVPAHLALRAHVGAYTTCYWAPIFSDSPCC